MNPRWLLRMARWSQRPPPLRRVIFVAAVIAVCLAMFLVERYFGWPAWLTLDPQRGGRLPRF